MSRTRTARAVTTVAVALALLAFAGAGCTAAVSASSAFASSSTIPQASDEFHWSGSLAVGQTLEIKNVNGPVYAELASGDEVEVRAVKHGDDRDDVRIEVLEHADGVTICAVYPGRWGREYECGAGDKGDLGSNRTDARVEFTIHVPEGVALDASTMNGRMQLDGLRSDVEALTMNGALHVSTTGWARAKTMNGAVEVRMGSADWSGDMEISTMNGRVDVWLPADADVDVEASTMSGRIESDWDMEISGWMRNKARGRVGDGGRRLEVSTMNGSIRIRRPS